MTKKNHQLIASPASLNEVVDKLLFICACFLIIFIPLYPKLPLFDIIPGYIVRVRLEDIFILVTGILWLTQVLRKKIPWQTPLTWWIAAYATTGFLTLVSALLVIQSIPLELLHIGKSSLHYLRYLEYFFLFFLLYTTCKTKQRTVIALTLSVFTTFAITIYGYGQKFLYWPVYSTMNREFSKGIRLYLTEHARVQSTFGGHYDLAAYLVVMLPFVLAIALVSRQWYLKIVGHVVFWFGLWLLIASASRTSFVAFLVSFGVLITLLMIKHRGNKWMKLWWGSSRGVALSVAMIFLILVAGQDMYDRMLQVIQGYPSLNSTYHFLNKNRKTLVELGPIAFLNNIRPNSAPPSNGVEVDNRVLVPTDERPTTTKPEPLKPSDVYVDVPDIKKVATTSATGEITYIEVDQGPRVYSSCALDKGLSLCIRLDTLWPQAIAGFMINPFFGKGYGTLNKESAYHFTEADSTDNNFLRTLGETGLLGFIAFYGTILIAMILVTLQWWRHSDWTLPLTAGFLAATIGLLVNAIYIDVFAASKVAFTFWAMTGLTLASSRFLSPTTTAISKSRKRKQK